VRQLEFRPCREENHNPDERRSDDRPRRSLWRSATIRRIVPGSTRSSKQLLAAGASENGPPGERSDIDENYYAAFVIDADGHNIEAVWHRPV